MNKKHNTIPTPPTATCCGR